MEQFGSRGGVGGVSKSGYGGKWSERGLQGLEFYESTISLQITWLSCTNGSTKCASSGSLESHTPPDYVLWSVLSSRDMSITEKMGELIVTLIRYLKVKWAPSLAPILVWTGTASAATIGTSPWFLGTET